MKKLTIALIVFCVASIHTLTASASDSKWACGSCGFSNENLERYGNVQFEYPVFYEGKLVGYSGTGLREICQEALASDRRCN